MDVQPYLDRRPDYSKEFTDRVSALAEQVASTVGAPVKHHNDMNYSVGQQIKIYLADDGSPAADERGAASALSVIVSSKGPLYTWLAWRMKQQPFGWFPVPLSELLDSPRARGIVDAVDQVMASAGLSHVPEDTLDEQVSGHVTDLDGAPATLRDVLFCEVC